MEPIKQLLSDSDQLSFGRTAALIIISFGLAVILCGMLMEYKRPTFPVEIKHINGNSTIIETTFVARPDWAGMSNFLMWGIGSLVGILYTGGRLITAGQNVLTSKNGYNGNGKKTEEI